MPKVVVKKILINDIYPPARYEDLQPGDTVVEIPRNRFWIVSDASEDTLTVFPYSGGAAYILPSDKSKVVFGKVDLPEELKERLRV